MQAPIFHSNEKQRLQALHDLALLDTPREERFDRLTQLCKSFFDVQIVAISLIDANRQWFKSSQGLEVQETSRDISFCGHTILQGGILEVKDALCDERFHDNPLVTGSPFIRFYAGTPVCDANGYPIATLCLIDTQPRQLKPSERQALVDFAATVERELNHLSHEQRLSQQQAQQQVLESIVASNVVAVTLQNNQGEIIYANPQAIEILGLDIRVSVDGSISYKSPPWRFESLEGGTFPVNELPFERLKHQGLPVEKVCYALVWPEGARKLLSVNGAPLGLTLANQVNPCYVFSMRDITEEVRIKQELSEALQVAEKASRAKSEFLANMSHEIRTPLNAILGLTELQLEQKMDFKSHQRLEQVARSGRLLLGIVNDLLDFSKIEAGKLSIGQDPFDLAEVADNLVTLFDLPASAKGLELLVHLQPQLPRQLLGDSLRLSQVLTNLTANAIKFTEQGFVEVAISEVSHDEHQLTLEFSVRDTGIGIPELQQQQLFQAFQQADESSTRKYGGVGLGLVISQRLVHLMGGSDIRLLSEPGQGTEFSFQLSFSYFQQTESEPKFPVVGYRLGAGRALVVDDQPIVRRVLTKILNSWGYEVLEAEDGLQAVTLVQQELQAERSLSVILMDWEMPHMNGLTALQQIRQLLEQQPEFLQPPAMLIISAHDRAEFMEEDATLGYLPKPIQRSSLYNALNHLQQPLQATTHNQMFCGQQVLVVEDNLINQQVVREQLEQLGLSVRVAENGQEALDAVVTDEIDLVLMDIQMPIMDGYQAARLIRQHKPDLPIIALTAAALFEDRQKALAAGMNDHLGKPFTGQQLFVHLQPWLETRERLDLELNTESERSESAGSSVPSCHSRKPRLLIVDDQPTNIKVLANQLKDDYRIQVASSGPRALKIARSDTPPDLVLLDIVMPDMDGYAVCRELKQDPQTSHLPVIFLSALSETEDEAKGLNLGAVDYITKPFHPAIVKSRIRNHVELKVKTDILESQLHIDGLTQVANRLAFDTLLVRESIRLVRSKQPLGLIMMDIDYFKPFNDNYGHGKGDDCLIKVAQALQSVIKRPCDLLARYGGEEFVALLPETDSEGVMRVAEQLRLAVEQLNYPHAHSKVASHVTVSLGCISALLTHHSPEELLLQADHALYQAKKSGRNQAVLSAYKTKQDAR